VALLCDDVSVNLRGVAGSSALFVEVRAMNLCRNGQSDGRLRGPNSGKEWTHLPVFRDKAVELVPVALVDRVKSKSCGDE